MEQQTPMVVGKRSTEEEWELHTKKKYHMYLMPVIKSAPESLKEFY